MDNATVSSLYCIALYDNYIALNDSPKVKKFLQELLKWENKNRKCTMPFNTKEFMKLMNLAIWY
jgi:hypothetical protein